MPAFQNKTVMLTGAAGNLGRAVAAAFAAQGARLVLVDLSLDFLQKSHGADSATQMLLAADLRDAAALKVGVDAAATRFGTIDALCNLAGGFRMGPAVHETPAEDWQALYDMNVRSMVNACAAVVPHMLAQKKGAIVNVGAAAAVKGGAQRGAYAATKDTVHRLTESMSAELREGGVRVNAVLPSILDTPANRADMPSADPAKWVAPAALAEVIVFLCSDNARAVHGALLPVTGLS